MSIAATRAMLSLSFFFFNDTATTEIYTLSLHDALPICDQLTIGIDRRDHAGHARHGDGPAIGPRGARIGLRERSEEHTSELQSQSNLVCRLLLEKTRMSQSTRMANSISTSVRRRRTRAP